MPWGLSPKVCVNASQENPKPAGATPGLSLNSLFTMNYGYPGSYNQQATEPIGRYAAPSVSINIPRVTDDDRRRNLKALGLDDDTISKMFQARDDLNPGTSFQKYISS